MNTSALPILQLQNNRFIRLILPLWKPAFLFGVLAVLNRYADENFRMTLEQSRPPLRIIALCLWGVALWQVPNLWRTIRTYYRQLTPSMSFRLAGWLPYLASAGLVLLVSLIGDVESNYLTFSQIQGIPLLLPLIYGIHMAFAFSIQDEPALEIQLTYPRPLAWTLLERLAVGFLLHSLIGCIGLLALARITEAAVTWQLMLGWLPSMVLMGGLGVYVTLSSEVSAFGGIVVGVVWYVAAQFGTVLMPFAPPAFSPLHYLQPFIWAFNPFLEYGRLADSDWLLNRLMVVGVGNLFLLLAVRELRIELFGKNS